MRSTKMRFCMARFLLQTGLGLYVQRLKMTQKNRKAHAGDECKTAIGKKIKYFSKEYRQGQSAHLLGWAQR